MLRSLLVLKRIRQCSKVVLLQQQMSRIQRKFLVSSGIQRTRILSAAPRPTGNGMLPARNVGAMCGNFTFSDHWNEPRVISAIYYRENIFQRDKEGLLRRI